MIKIYYEEYHNDYNRKNHEKIFSNLQKLEDWIFSQMKQDYSDKECGSHFLSFPTPEQCKRMNTEGPWRISFTPDYGGPDYLIRQIKNDNGIIFSDGQFTAGKRHWSKEVQNWLIHCHNRQFSPQFDFAE